MQCVSGWAADAPVASPVAEPRPELPGWVAVWAWAAEWAWVAERVRPPEVLRLREGLDEQD